MTDDRHDQRTRTGRPQLLRRPNGLVERLPAVEPIVESYRKTDGAAARGDRRRRRRLRGEPWRGRFVDLVG